MELLVLLIGLVIVGLLAARFGHDSRPGFGTLELGIGALEANWTDPIYDDDLARETQEARLRRLASSNVVVSGFQQAEDELAPAA